MNPSLYPVICSALGIPITTAKPEIVESILRRVEVGSDIGAVLAAINSVIRGSDQPQKEELIVGFLPSVQIALSSGVKDLDSYGQQRSRIYPLLDPDLRAVWRRWEEQLPFDAASSLPE